LLDAVWLPDVAVVADVVVAVVVFPEAFADVKFTEIDVLGAAVEVMEVVELLTPLLAASAMVVVAIVPLAAVAEVDTTEVVANCVAVEEAVVLA